MSTKTSLVEILHDTGYGDDLVWHINVALRGKDMRAVRTVESVESVNTDLLEACKVAMDFVNLYANDEANKTATILGQAIAKARSQE